MLNVLIVDDSAFFQRRLKDIINEHPQLNVIGVASNGVEAIEKVASLKPDIVTMDYEMPIMDGVTAVKKIMETSPLPILMLSSLTFEGAKVTLDALEAGAVDFMTKNFAEISSKTPTIKKRIYECLLAIAGAKNKSTSAFRVKPAVDRVKPEAKPLRPEPIKPAERPIEKQHSPKKAIFHNGRPKLIVIGTSTGGPVALANVLSGLPSQFPIPILLVQHMPEKFTQAFSERLNQICHIRVTQAEDGESLKPGCALLAPGGKQLIINSKQPSKVRVIDSDKPVNYKPSVDITFASAASVYGADTLAIVLTGMGADGRDGAGLLKQKRATIWTQSQSTCVVYGMPMSVDKAGYSDLSLDLDDISDYLIEISKK